MSKNRIGPGARHKRREKMAIAKREERERQREVDVVTLAIQTARKRLAEMKSEEADRGD